MSSVKTFHENFYGSPSVDETRRRRGKKRHTAEKEEPQNEVAVIGVHYRSFDDDSMAAFVNSATALVPWNGDSKLLIDRYDVRHLLQDLTGIRRRRTRPPSPDATKEELDYERYRDVEGLENPSLPEDESKIEDTTDGGYQRVGFDYGNGGDEASRKERIEDTLFIPPFFVPEHLRLNIRTLGFRFAAEDGTRLWCSYEYSLLQADERGNVQPRSTKAHQIMAGTAKYVIEHGAQVEIVLRVKQAYNPTFGFLMPDHNDHEYFRFLVAHPEHVGIGPTLQQETVAEVAVATSSEEAEGGLSLLGTAYGDSDEDEDDDKGGEARQDQAEEPQVVSAEDVEKVEDDPKQHIDLNSDLEATITKSPTINLNTSDGAESAMKDTGGSLELSHESEFPKGTGEASEVPLERMVGSSVSQEPVPPGMEASTSGSGEKEGQELNIRSEDLDDQVPPYKEPPIRLRLIIDKMVEFILRNGKEFEAIVKERDKTDHRFPFFLPWNEYHPYYLKQLESASQAQLSVETDATRIPSTSEPRNPSQGQVADENEDTESFLNGVPFWDMSQAVESKGGDAEGGMPDTPEGDTLEGNEDRSHNGEGGMGFDAVLAAVRFATRGRPQAVEGNNETDLPKVSGGNEKALVAMGSDGAVLAAIRAATGRSTLDSSGSASKEEISHVARSIGPSGKDAKDPFQTSTISRGAGSGDTKDLILTSTSSFGASGVEPSDSLRTTLPQLTAEAPVGSDEDRVVVPLVVTKAAALSTSEERDSTEAQLTTPEKRKAERLKKAKLFAAMIKDKNGSLTNPLQLSGELSGSAQSLDRLNNVSMASESTTMTPGVDREGAVLDTEPETRGQSGDTQVHVPSEADKELLDSSVKQIKHKVKTKELEEKKRKHHHRRKKDTEDKGFEGKQSPDTDERRKDKHHHNYQDDKRKERKHDLEPEGSGKYRKWGVSDEKLRIDEAYHDREDRMDEFLEARRDKGHYTRDSRGRRKESKYDYDTKDNNTGDKHGRDSEGSQRRSRHVYDSDDDRREDGHKYDTNRKRKDRRHRHNSEERRSEDRYEYDSDERRKERSRSHEKRKRHSDRADESDDKDGRKHEHRTKKKRRHGDDYSSATEIARAERQSLPTRDLKNEKKERLVSPEKQDLSVGTSGARIRVEEKKSTLSSVDVPDDIRAKVRAMLAMM